MHLTVVSIIISDRMEIIAMSFKYYSIRHLKEFYVCNNKVDIASIFKYELMKLENFSFDRSQRLKAELCKHIVITVISAIYL